MTTYTYNNLNLVRSMTLPGDSNISSLAITYKYTKLGQTAESLNTLGKKQVITYDNQGNILTTIKKISDDTQDITRSFAYDKAGNLRYETDGNGNITELIDQQNTPPNHRSGLGDMSRYTFAVRFVCVSVFFHLGFSACPTNQFLSAMPQ